MGIGKEQLFMFVVTIIGVLATDLLVGVVIGILTKFTIHMLRGVRLNNLFKIHFLVEQINGETILVEIVGAAIFSNFMALKNAITQIAPAKKVVFQLNNAYLIDHTVMEFMHNFRHTYEANGGVCEFLGMEVHDTFSKHPLAVRKMKPDNKSRRKTDYHGLR